MLSSFARQEVFRLRPARIRDRYQKLVDDWTNAQPVSIGICVFVPDNSDETFVNGERVISRYRLAAPKDADLSAGDRIVVEGVTYLVDGDPAQVPSPSGRLDYTEAFAVRMGVNP